MCALYYGVIFNQKVQNPNSNRTQPELIPNSTWIQPEPDPNSTQTWPDLDPKIDLNPILIQTRLAHFCFKMVHCMAKCNRKKGSKATHHLAWGHLPRIKIAIERILCIRKNKSKSHLWTQNVINLINDAEATKQSLVH